MEKEELFAFLESVDYDFPVPLSEKVNLESYAFKLLERGNLYFERREKKIVALVAGYHSNVDGDMAYIALVAVRKEARGKGYARRLVGEFVEDCRRNGMRAVHLYTHHTNSPAIHIYKEMGFVEYRPENEPRPQDMHLILNL